MTVSATQCAELTRLVGKAPGEIKIGLIENAADIIPNSTEWLGGFRDMLSSNGYRIEIINLKEDYGKTTSLKDRLERKDVICLGGGHTYYLRWLLRHTGADDIITELIGQGKVYAGWSAGAIVAGPTTLYFDAMGDDPRDTPACITDGLHLTDTVIVPHVNNPDFTVGAAQTGLLLTRAGFKTQPLNDDEVFVQRGKNAWVVPP